MSTAESTSALVCDLQRFTVHDGEGIRTAIFFKGCPLRCAWCHNPEAIDFANQPMLVAEQCIACGECAQGCPRGAISLGRDCLSIDRQSCEGCLRCAEACPSGATRKAARPLEVAEIVRTVCRDRDFYGDEGGVTLTGGEPLSQVAFVGCLLAELKRAELDVVVETAGHWAWSQVEPLLPDIDRILFDLKIVDRDRHMQLCGRDNDLILDNLTRLLRGGHRVEVRMPLVVGATCDRDNLTRVAALLVELGVGNITLLEYHGLGEDKARQLGRDRRKHGRFAAPSTEELARARAFFRDCGVQTRIV